MISTSERIRITDTAQKGVADALPHYRNLAPPVVREMFRSSTPVEIRGKRQLWRNARRRLMFEAVYSKNAFTVTKIRGY